MLRSALSATISLADVMSASPACTWTKRQANARSALETAKSAPLKTSAHPVIRRCITCCTQTMEYASATSTEDGGMRMDSGHASAIIDSLLRKASAQTAAISSQAALVAIGWAILTQNSLLPSLPCITLLSTTSGQASTCVNRARTPKNSSTTRQTSAKGVTRAYLAAQVAPKTVNTTAPNASMATI